MMVTKTKQEIVKKKKHQTWLQLNNCTLNSQIAPENVLFTSMSMSFGNASIFFSTWLSPILKNKL